MKKWIFFLIFLIFSNKAFSEKVQILPIWNEKESTYFQILLPLDKDLKISVFRHNRYTYFIFDSKKNLSIDENKLKDFSLILLKHPSALILRGVLEDNLKPEIERQGNDLSIKMLDTPNTEETLFETQKRDEGLLIELKNTEIIEFKDPNTKENLIVFLTPFAPIFIEEKYDTPEMTFLPTYQGIAIYPKTEELEIIKDKDGYVILPQNIKNFTKNIKSATALMTDLNNYARLTDNEFKNKLQRLKDFIPHVSEYGKNRLHLEIAKLNLSHGFVERSLEVLDTVEENNQKNILLFLSFIYQKKPQKALSVWPKIKNPNMDLKLWKNSIDENTLYELNYFNNVSLPEKLNFLFWYKLGLKAIKQKNSEILSLSIEKIEPLSKNIYQNQAYLYLKAKLYENTEKQSQSKKIYKEIAFNPLSILTGEILYSKIKLDLEQKDISEKQALNALEKIRTLTTNTPTETLVLKKLSSLYYKTGNIAQALRTDRKLLSLTKDINILKRMKKEFEKFFASHQNPRPFEHSALYIEFKELIPSGLKGLQIKQHFLHDLVALDLLEEAYEIAIQISQTTKGYIQQETAIQAYLIANMLSDSQRINESSLYLPNNWNNFSIPESWNETLKQAFKIYK